MGGWAKITSKLLWRIKSSKQNRINVFSNKQVIGPNRKTNTPHIPGRSCQCFLINNPSLSLKPLNSDEYVISRDQLHQTARCTELFRAEWKCYQPASPVVTFSSNQVLPPSLTSAQAAHHPRTGITSPSCQNACIDKVHIVSNWRATWRKHQHRMSQGWRRLLLQQVHTYK